MIIHHKSPQGQLAQLSIFLEIDQEAPVNTFFTNIEPDLWEAKEGFSLDLEKDVLLEELEKGGLTDFFDLSFFWYLGSETVPPCKEGVSIYVLEHPLKIAEP